MIALPSLRAQRSNLRRFDALTEIATAPREGLAMTAEG
jgi:hypothetical protein